MITELTAAITQKPYHYWLKKNRYYHKYLQGVYAACIPQGKRVLQVGCKTGSLLAATKPSYGVGIDQDIESLHYAQKKYPHLHFFSNETELTIEQKQFDYIILSSTLMECEDIQQLLTSLKKYAHSGTRLLIDGYRSCWEPILSVAQKIGMRRPTQLKTWLSRHDIATFLYLSGWEEITYRTHLLVPFYIPFITWFLNSLLATIPFIRSCALLQMTTARLKPASTHQDRSVSILIPCKNERGTIQQLVDRIPHLGTSTELIFIEGGSADGTWQEILRVQAETTKHKIKAVQQKNKGKGDAVVTGLHEAEHDIVMILDGDMTVSPEDLSKFYEVLVSGKADCVNGSRFVYQMEEGATRFLNLIANHCFAMLFSWLLGQNIKDTLCGTKVLWTNDARMLFEQRVYFNSIDPFGDFDILFGAARFHFKIVDLPIIYKTRQYGETQIHRFWHGTLLLYMSFVAFKKLKMRGIC